MFLIALTGGYEPPAFYATSDKDTAMEKFAEWTREVTADSGEEVKVMFINTDRENKDESSVKDFPILVLETYIAEEE